ncbi:MAG TPA: FtsX-like permease family protein [Ktedonobacterales bacterium]|nr:FtsX-like permease family protein [Ktedonobacterales bacterium]
MKAKMYWSYATRSLARNGQRTLLAIFCVAVGVLAIVALQLVNDDIQVGYVSNVRVINGGDVALNATSVPLQAAQLSEFDQLRSDGTITDYTAVDTVDARITTADATMRAPLQAVDPTRFPLATGVIFANPSNGSVASLVHDNSVVISTTLARVFNFKLGDTFSFSARDGRTAIVTVAGIVNSGGLFQGSTLVMARDAYAALPATGAQQLSYTNAYFNVPGHSGIAATALERDLRARFPLAATRTSQELASTAQAQAKMIRYFLQIVALLALLIGGVGILNTMQVALRRRRTEIATLKTTGYRARDLYTLFGLEAGLIGLAGGVIGAAAGVSVSFLVKDLMQNVFEVVFPTSLNIGTIFGGVAVGFFATLIFGLAPIIRASAVRPKAVLRETPEHGETGGKLLGAALFGVVVILFFALGYSILQNLPVTLGAVGGTGLLLSALGLIFTVVVVVIGRLPVPSGFRWTHALLVTLALAAGLALARFVPVFGALIVFVALLGLVVALLPRSWKATIKLAFRNLARRKSRSVATLIALFIGMFTIGIVLGLGANIESLLHSAIAKQDVNIAVVARTTDRAAVQQQLARTAGLSHQFVSTLSQDAPVSINGQSAGTAARGNAGGANAQLAQTLADINGTQGYDLAGGMTLNSTLVPLMRGSHDAGIGRTLNASDAGTTNALLPATASQAPLNLRLGDTLTLADTTTRTQVTVTIVGFYRSTFALEPVLVDNSVVNTLSNGDPSYAYFAYVGTKDADRTLAHIQAAVPTAQTYNAADTLTLYSSIINSMMTVLTAIASLALLAGVLIIANTVALAMLERRREIGILKAVGYTSRSVLGEVLVENAAIGFTGAVTAMLLVAIAIALLAQALFGLSMSVAAPIVIGLVGGSAVVCMAVGAAVAWQAARVRPLEVLRYE